MSRSRSKVKKSKQLEDEDQDIENLADFILEIFDELVRISFINQ